MLKELKLLKEILDKEKAVAKARKRLNLAELDYNAIKVMVDEAVSKNVRVEIRNGTNIITIVPTENGKINYRSFKDRFENFHNGGQ